VADVQDDLRPRGEEQFDVVGVTQGAYTLSVKIAPGPIASGDYVIRLDARRAATDADRVMQDGRTARAQAHRLETSGKDDEATPLFERALTLSERVRGADDPYVAMVAYDLAGNALTALDYTKAQGLYERAATALEKVYGPSHPYAAMARS